jgi:hypothetical protein
VAVLIGGTRLFASDLPPFEINFNETGFATYVTSAGTAGIADSFFEEDDAGANVLVYRLPGLTWSGAVDVFGEDGALEDVLVLSNANGAVDGADDASLLAVYSADDSGLPANTGASLASVSEAANERFQYVAADGAVFNGAPAPGAFFSNAGVLTPEPASAGIFLIGVAGVAFGVCRRRKRG